MQSSDSELPATRPANTIRIDLNGVMLELPDVLITDLISQNMPDMLNPQAQRNAKERVMRLTFKGAMRLFLGYVEGQIKDKGANLPLPNIPTDEHGDEADALEYGVYYILALGLSLLTRSDLHAEVKELDDGTLRITRLSATEAGVVEDADVDATSKLLLGAGKDANSGVSSGADTSANAPATR